MRTQDLPVIDFGEGREEDFSSSKQILNNQRKVVDDMRVSTRGKYSIGSPVKWVPNRILNCLKKAGSTVRMVDHVEGIKSYPNWRCTICGGIWTEMTESILRKAKEHPVGCRNCGYDGHTCDHGILDSMTPSAAYVLGCWWARGRAITKQARVSSNVIFTSRNTKVLKHLASVMSATRPTFKCGKGQMLRVASVRIASKLKGLNRKTLPDKIPNSLIRPFLLGYLDMQGQFEYGLDKDNPYLVRIDFGASPTFTQRIRRLWLGGRGNKRGKGHIHVSKRGYGELRIVGTKAPTSFLDWLYGGVMDDHPYLVYRGEMFMCWTFLRKLASRVERLRGYVASKSEEYNGLRVGMRQKLRGIREKYDVSYDVVMRVRSGGNPPRTVPVRFRKPMTKEARGINMMWKRARGIVDEVSSRLMVCRSTAFGYLHYPDRAHFKKAFNRSTGELVRVPRIRERKLA
jgi:hypothetical protein